MRKALVAGGASGIGLAIATQLAARDDYSIVHIVDRAPVPEGMLHEKFECHRFDLTSQEYGFFDRFMDIDTLMITAGFGHLALFKDLTEDYIANMMNVNAVAVMRLIRRFYDRIASADDFYCGVMVSIAGFMSSPFFSVYGASKAALKIFIESVNVELEKAGFSNRILNVSPGSIKGTGFNQGQTDLALTEGLAKDIIRHLECKDDLFIPQYEEIFKNVLERYHADFREEGRHSYDYKLNSGRIKDA